MSESPHSNSVAHQPQDEHEEGWLVSYADMVTLLLAVFVLLFSMSTMESQKATEVSKTIANYMRKKEAPTDIAEDVTAEGRKQYAFDSLASLLNLSNADDLVARLESLKGDEKEQATMRKTLEQLGLAGNSTLTHVRPRYDIVIPGDLLFAPGSAALRDQSATYLKNLAPTLRQLSTNKKKVLEIAGHGDGTDGGAEKGPGGPQILSVMRANAVFRELAKDGVPPAKMRIVGVGNSEPVWPERLADGKLDQDAQRRNRRVVISVLSF